MGAWPVVGFLASTFFSLQFAFRLNYRAARASEESELDRERLIGDARPPPGGTVGRDRVQPLLGAP